ncbi:Flp family type IVb pilin [Pseudomonas wadenswilerensis]
MTPRIRAFLNDESGVTAIEYGILAAAMAAAIGIIFGEDGVFISALKDRFAKIGNQINGDKSGAAQ